MRSLKRDERDMTGQSHRLNRQRMQYFLDSSDMGIEEVLETMISVYEKSK